MVDPGERASVLVTRRIYPDALRLLEASFDVTVLEGDGGPTRTALLAGVRGRQGLLCLLTDRVDGAVMDAAGPGLRVIANHAVGYDNVDLDAATRRGIQVTNTPGVLTESTADLTWGLLLAVARRLVTSDRYVREGRFRGWGPLDFLGFDLEGKTLGIVGMGRIGRAVARRAFGFGMRVVYASRTERPVRLWGDDARVRPDFDFGPHRVPLELLLREADFVSLHVPLDPGTRHLIDGPALELMKSTACLINTARGPVVDEAALVTALREGKIAGAGLDVYEREPELAEGLAGLDTAVLLPHIGSATYGTRRRMALTAAENLRAVLEGGQARNLVNADVLG